MYSVARVVICLLPLIVWISPAPAEVLGTVSGTISLETHNVRGLARIPAGSLITVSVKCLSGNPDALHFSTCDTARIIVPKAASDSVAYRFTGLSPGRVVVDGEVSALNPGPHHWSATLGVATATAGVSIDRRSPHVVVDLSASGVYVPPDATADGTTPLGFESAAIELHRSVPHGPLPSTLPDGLRIVAFAARNPDDPIASVTPGTLHPNGVGTLVAPFEIDGLPVGTPLVIRLVAPAGAMPNLTYRHTGIDPTSSAHGETCTVTIPVDFREDVSCNFSAVPAPPLTSGSFAGRIVLVDADGPSVDPGSVHVSCVRSDTHAPVGSAILGAAVDAEGVRYLPLRITDLPLGVALTIAVTTDQPHPLPTGFVNLTHFRRRNGGCGSETWTGTLDAAHPANSDLVDFVPYTLEVPPLPHPPASPSSTPGS